MKKALSFILAAAMAVSLTACGRKPAAQPSIPNTPPPAQSEPAPGGADDWGMEEEYPDNAITVPEPPEAKSYLPGLFPCLNYSESVEINGLQANYSIHAEYDGCFFTCEGEYYLTLEYDDAEQEWNRVDDGWLERTYTLNEAGFAENYCWIIFPKQISDGMLIYFEDVTPEGCTLSWESRDENFTINGELSGSVACTFAASPENSSGKGCWMLEGAEFVYNENYYAGRYQEWIYEIMLYEDNVTVTTEAFVNSPGFATVRRVEM